MDAGPSIRIDVSGTKKSLVESLDDYDRIRELKAFDNTKADVKELVHVGIAGVLKYLYNHRMSSLRRLPLTGFNPSHRSKRYW